MLEMRRFSLPPLPPTVDVCCVVLFFHRAIRAVLMRSKWCMLASLEGFKPATSVYTHKALTTTHTAQLQSHSAVILRLSFNLQGREGAPRAQTHDTLNLSRRRATAA